MNQRLCEQPPMALTHLALCPLRTGILTENKDSIMCFIVASLEQLYVLVFSNEVIMNQ